MMTARICVVHGTEVSSIGANAKVAKGRWGAHRDGQTDRRTDSERERERERERQREREAEREAERQ